MSTDTHSAALRERLAALAPSVKGSSLYAIRSLSVTLDGLQAMERFFESFAAVLFRIAQETRAVAVAPEDYLDATCVLVDTLEESYRMLDEKPPSVEEMNALIEQDGQYSREQKELLRLAWDRGINSMLMLSEACKDLRAAVISHDLAAEPPPSETFDSAEALIRSLHAHS